MLKGLLIVFWIILGFGLTYLGYGVEGIKVRKDLEIDTISAYTALSIGMCCTFWGYALTELINGNKITQNLLIVIGLAFIYAIWFRNTRKDTKRLIEQAKIPLTFERIRSSIPGSVLDDCKEFASNRPELEKVLLKCVSEGRLKKRYVPILLNKFAPDNQDI